MGVLSTDLLMVERSGTLHKAAVGNLPAPGKTAATLTHSGGVATLDVQAADVFRFEADEYVAGSAPWVAGATSRHGPGSITLPGSPTEGDLVIFCEQGSSGSSVPAGYTEIKDENGNNPDHTWSYKIMGAAPDTTVSTTNTGTDLALAVVIRGADPGSPLDAAYQRTYAATGNATPISMDAPSVTTVTDNTLNLLAFFARLDAANNLSGGAISGYTLAAEIESVDGGQYDEFLGVFHKVIAAAGPENAPAHSKSFAANPFFFGYWAYAQPIRGLEASGEKDYTFALSNIPSSGIAEGKIDIELKTDTGSVAFAGGTVTWRGTEPTFDAVGRYLIGFIADATGITLWREG